MGRTLFSSKPGKNTPAAPFLEKQLRQLLESCDADADGRLSKSELRTAFAKLGTQIPRFRAYQGMSMADRNGDGLVDSQDNEELIKFALSLGYKWNK